MLLMPFLLPQAAKQRKIFLAGFDGYSRQDRRLKIVDELFYLFSSAKSSVPVVTNNTIKL